MAAESYEAISNITNVTNITDLSNVTYLRGDARVHGGASPLRLPSRGDPSRLRVAPQWFAERRRRRGGAAGIIRAVAARLA